MSKTKFFLLYLYVTCKKNFSKNQSQISFSSIIELKRNYFFLLKNLKKTSEMCLVVKISNEIKIFLLQLTK